MNPLAAIAVAIFALGFAWQYGGWILEWVGRAFGVRGISSSYEAFVESFAASVGAGGLVRILAPWLLMGIGVLLFVVARRREGQSADG